MTGTPLVASLGVALAVGLGAVAMVAAAVGDTRDPVTVEIEVHYSRFAPSVIEVPDGRPVTFVITNTDPIDHEWIVGDEAVHAVHRTGTELLHPSRPTEVVIPAGESRTAIVTFEAAGTLQYICHLPAHEAYGMVGTVTIR
jgi:uncharacterized cupredoxin-like copper-binding protein